jgi:casein kinase II subunit beta
VFSFLEVYQAAMDLYGLIHARFILSPRGLAMMREKFLLGAFGMCQRILCDRQVVLPIGLSEELSTSRVKIFCPRCQEVYVPRQKHLDIDGAYFGISFANILFKTYPDLYPKDGPLTYQPLIFGFKIFGQRGSAHEEQFDNSGHRTNKSAAEVLTEIK